MIDLLIDFKLEPVGRAREMQELLRIRPWHDAARRGLIDGLTPLVHPRPEELGSLSVGLASVEPLLSNVKVLGHHQRAA